MQTHKLPQHNLVLIYGRKYWDKVLNWKVMMKSGTINVKEYSMLRFADTVDDAFEQVRAVLETYHLELDPDTYG